MSETKPIKSRHYMHWVKFNAYKQTTIFTNGSIPETSECKTQQSKRFRSTSESFINSKEVLS